MDRVLIPRRVAEFVGGWLASLLLLVPGSGGAFEAIDGRLEAHGYFEMQLRTISQNFSDQWDLTQWYNIFNVELELDLIQDTHGPIDLMSAFIRIEARFDCIYSRGCGMIRGVDVYGNRARRLPGRLNNGKGYTYANSIPISADGPYADAERDPFTIRNAPGFGGIYEATPEGLGLIDRRVSLRCGSPTDARNGASAFCDPVQENYKAGRLPARFWNANRNERDPGPGGLSTVDDGTSGSPYLIAMSKFNEFEFTAISQIGGSSNGHPILLMGPWLPKNYVEPNATLSSLPNPLDSSRVSPQSLAAGFGANPMRAIPVYRENDPEASRIYIFQENTPDDPKAGVDTGRWQVINPSTGEFSDQRAWGDRSGRGSEPRGIFMPTTPLRQGMDEGKFDSYPFNFSQLQRAFNRGASQQDEGELKEAYLDIEMFDYRLWLRIGKQSIVWGKTELFRTTDQFNPQDLALATLPSLEESRIALWSARGVWSFYDVGPLTDVRLELALNFDEHEAADLGTCGEPYAVNLICGLTLGSWAHGFTGVGIAGFEQPPNPWDDASGLEYGARLEWRWDRFSFAITDFYGYDDFPHVVRLSSYGRNVDWRSGRPRVMMPDVPYMADPATACAAPGFEAEVGGVAGVVTQGVIQTDDAGNIQPYDFDQVPNSVGARIDYASAAGFQRAGCLTPGATNREFRVAPITGPDGEAIGYYGVPYRVPFLPQSGGYPRNNSLYRVSGRFMNDSAFSDPDDPRRHYSKAELPSGTRPESREDWPVGPQAHLCVSESNPSGLPTSFPGCGDTERGQRTFDPIQFFEANAGPCQGLDDCPYEGLPNPGYNPYYDPRFDRYFDAGQVTKAGWFSEPANPGDHFAEDPVPFDAFQVSGTTADQRYMLIWQNAYNPGLEVYDSRNSLYQSPVNSSLFNWICSATVGFSDLDLSACALTVFSSSKEPAGESQGSSAPRIATLIGAFISGNLGFNGFLGRAPADRLLSKGPTLPYGMGMPLIYLHEDMDVGNAKESDGRIGIGRGVAAFRTRDVRRQWAVSSTSEASPRWIYAREQESYNCYGNFPVTNGLPGGVQLCGGLEIRRGPGDPERRFRVGTFLGRVLTPEQEALIGCGPYFGISCDANGADLLWMEASALLQSFVGSDSIGISFDDLGIGALVSSDYGLNLMDNGSPAIEYRTDSRVVDKFGNLIRIDKPDLNQPGQWAPALGSKGYIANGAMGNAPNPVLLPGGGIAPCTITTERLVMPDGTLNPNRDRAASRCWDLRDYYHAWGVQPGTATFEILELGGPNCTTADIGGPEGSVAGVLPGCRNKWATILYQPLSSWKAGDRLHPNNPDAGYVGNHWFGQVFSYRSPRFRTDVPADPRKDYRQWSKNRAAYTEQESLAYDIPCGDGGTPANPADPNLPENYDCYLFNPTTGSPNGNAKASVVLPSDWKSLEHWQPGTAAYEAARASVRSGLNWGVFSPDNSDCNPTGSRPETQMRNDPDCYLGGWRQTVDGDPDRVGLAKAAGGPDASGALRYPFFVKAIGLGQDKVIDGVQVYADDNFLVQYGERVEGGCTKGVYAAYLQKHVGPDGVDLFNMAECAETFRGNPVANLANRGGSGHIFTGESFANEMAAASKNLEIMLVTFSPEFTDGLASVRGFVNPEVYESRYIYDEPWMWDFYNCPSRDPGATSPPELQADCEGLPFVGMIPPKDGYPDGNASDFDQNGNWLPRPSQVYRGHSAYSAYGNPNLVVSRDPSTNLMNPTAINKGRIRQVSGWRLPGVNNLGDRWNPGQTPTDQQWENYAIDRKVALPNPLSSQPAGTENKLQRSPNLPNILTAFPDLLMRECNSARRDYREDMTAAEIRALYEQCGRVKEDDPDGYSGKGDWAKVDRSQSENAGVPATWEYWQAMRLGNSYGQGGLLESMLWDYAFTGSENDLMAIIPYCEDLSYTQRDVEEIYGENGIVTPFSFGANRIDCSRGEEGEVLGRERCTFVTPQYCSLVQSLAGIAGQKRNDLRAGGNRRFGRRTAQWQSGSEAYLSYEKRNVLGFSMDFAEDTTKSNWSVEFTWMEGIPQMDADSYNFTTDTDDFNLTVSMDRPTFINFLNANRTFFFNTQWFFQYRKGWKDSFSAIGPWNLLATFAIVTGYFQDRLNPQLVFVYDFRSRSGGALPQVNYRFSENFSITVGASLFTGGSRYVTMPVNGIAPASIRGGRRPYMDGNEPFLSAVRDRDEVFMVLRYTF